MRKVGIITFHLAVNYGAVLQCYALQSFLKQAGYDVKVIDYHPDFRKRRESIVNRVSLLDYARKVYVFARDYFPSRIRWTVAFSSFVKRQLMTTSKCSADTIPSEFDSYVIGSDQLWNFSITGGPHPVFFAEFPFKKEDRHYISYAVSMEVTNVNASDEEQAMRFLENFDAISVREQNAIDFLCGKTDKTIYKTIDPTLLVDRSVWDSFAITPKRSQKYVLLYQVRQNGHARKVAEELAAQRGAIVVEIASGLNKSDENSIKHVSPESFVGWFKEADCVVTTSFHGTAFSLIFQKPFYAINLGDGWDNRVGSLLKNVGLESRSIQLGRIPTFEDIDYDLVENKISVLRKESADFLLNNL